ncbi:MAG: LysE family translocator [Paracoccaceae bacterium]
MLTFAISVFLLIITPGPGVLSTAGFGAAYGFKQSLRYVFGLFLGTNLVFLAVASGLIAVLLSVPSLRIFLLFLSTCYLFYLASKIALAGSNIAFIKAKAPPGITSGVLLQAINPKAYVVNTTFVSGFAFYQSSFAIELIIKFFIINAIWIPLHLLWLYAGTVLHDLNLSNRNQRIINLMLSFSMIAAVVISILYSF